MGRHDDPATGWPCPTCCRETATRPGDPMRGSQRAPRVRRASVGRDRSRVAQRSFTLALRAAHRRQTVCWGDGPGRAAVDHIERRCFFGLPSASAAGEEPSVEVRGNASINDGGAISSVELLEGENVAVRVKEGATLVESAAERYDAIHAGAGEAQRAGLRRQKERPIGKIDAKDSRVGAAEVCAGRRNHALPFDRFGAGERADHARARAGVVDKAGNRCRGYEGLNDGRAERWRGGCEHTGQRERGEHGDHEGTATGAPLRAARPTSGHPTVLLPEFCTAGSGGYAPEPGRREPTTPAPGIARGRLRNPGHSLPRCDAPTGGPLLRAATRHGRSSGDEDDDLTEQTVTT